MPVRRGPAQPRVRRRAALREGPRGATPAQQPHRRPAARVRRGPRPRDGPRARRPLRELDGAAGRGDRGARARRRGSAGAARDRRAGIAAAAAEAAAEAATPPPPAAPAPPPPAPPRAPGSPAQNTVLVDAPPPVAEPKRAPAGRPKPPRPPRTAPALRLPGGPWVVPAAALAAAAIGFGIGGVLAGDPAEPPARVAAGELGTVEIPAALRSTRGPAGLGLQSLRAYAGAEGSARRIAVVGSGEPAGPNLVPAGALADAARDGKVPTVVRVGDAQALRFDGLTVAGLAGRTQLLALPTDDGVLVAACAAPAAGDDVCASVLGSLAPRGGARPAAVAASPEYADAIRQRLTTYESARAAATRLLRSAGRSATQAQAARRLATAAGTLATGLGALDTVPGARPAQEAAAAAAGRLRLDARRLAAAASARSRAGYRSAARDVESADGALRRAVDRLRDVYRRN